MLFQSIIHSKLTYLHRVLVPTPVQIEEIDKLTRSALWTKSFKGHEYGRTKISKKKLEAPLVAGGLGIPPASSLVFRSQINSALANWKYFIFNPSATWNKLHNLDHRGTKLIHTGSKKLPRNSAFLKKLGPVSDATIETLGEVLDFRESLPERWNRIPLIGSKYENIFNSITHSDLTRINFQVPRE